MNNKIIISLLMGIILIQLVSADSLGTFKQDKCINLIQSCDNCTFSNITTVIYPNSSIAIKDKIMTKSNFDYNYSFCNTNNLGQYTVNGISDLDGINTVWNYDFWITKSGFELTMAEAQTGSTATWLIFVLGFALIIGGIYTVATSQTYWYFGLFFIGLGIVIMFYSLTTNLIISNNVLSSDLGGKADTLIGKMMVGWRVISYLVIIAGIIFGVTYIAKKLKDKKESESDGWKGGQY